MNASRQTLLRPRFAGEAFDSQGAGTYKKTQCSPVHENGTASSLVAGQLYQVDVNDPLAHFGVPLVIALVALASVSYAARAATKVEPMKSLRAI